YFKKDLESEKIWDVGDYVVVTFIGESDAGAPPKGIPAAYELLSGLGGKMEPEKVQSPTAAQEKTSELKQSRKDLGKAEGARK
ncbi:MAG TPA: hypothetical protein VLS90_05870, partial [Thermodesulfobacteriota bacterium]|nr:hypothetical protein [Thermodesulfobacteriota bacterium]